MLLCSEEYGDAMTSSE